MKYLIIFFLAVSSCATKNSSIDRSPAATKKTVSSSLKGVKMTPQNTMTQEVLHGSSKGVICSFKAAANATPIYDLKDEVQFLKLQGNFTAIFTSAKKQKYFLECSKNNTPFNLNELTEDDLKAIFSPTLMVQRDKNIHLAEAINNDDGDDDPSDKSDCDSLEDDQSDKSRCNESDDQGSTTS